MSTRHISTPVWGPGDHAEAHGASYRRVRLRPRAQSNRANIIKTSRQRYGRSRTFVEEKIRTWLDIPAGPPQGIRQTKSRPPKKPPSGGRFPIFRGEEE